MQGVPNANLLQEIMYRPPALQVQYPKFKERHEREAESVHILLNDKMDRLAKSVHDHLAWQSHSGTHVDSGVFLLLYCRAPTEMILRSKRVNNREQEHRGHIPAGIYNGANEGQTNELCLWPLGPWDLQHHWVGHKGHAFIGGDDNGQDPVFQDEPRSWCSPCKQKTSTFWIMCILPPTNQCPI